MKAIILATYSKNEKYIDYCIKALDALWPNHPEIWVFTDRGNFKYKKKVIIKDASWVKIVEAGTRVLVKGKKIKENDYILFLLEDHIPLERVPADLINQIAKYSKEKEINFVSLTGHGGGKRAAEIGKQELFQVYNDFRFYSEYHPAIWRVSHLINIMERARKVNCKTAWDSEHVRDPRVKHYTMGRYAPGEFIWPSFFGGFLNRGRVSIKSLKKMRHPVFKGLKKILIKDYILELPAYCGYRLRRKLNTLLRRYSKKKQS